MIYLLIIYILFFIFFFNRAKYLIPAIIFTAPLERFNVYHGFTLSPIIILFPIVLAVFFSLIIKKVITMEMLISNKSLIGILLFVYLANLLSVINSISKTDSFKATFYVLIYLLYIYLFYILVKIYKDWTLIMYSTAITIGILSVYGIYQFIAFKVGLPLTLPFEHLLNSKTLAPQDFISTIRNVVYLRPNISFSDVNSTAGFILIYLPLLFVLSLYSHSKGKNLFMITFFLAFIVFIMMFSRGAIISSIVILAILIGYFVVNKFKIIIKVRDKKFSYLIIPLLVMIVILISILQYSRLSLNNIEKTTNNSDRQHLELAYAGLDMFKNSELIGNGVSSFSNYYFKYEANKIKDKFVSVDNPPVYIKWLGELGIIGLIANLVLILYVIKLNVQKLMSLNINFKEKMINLGLLIGLLTILGDNLVHAYLALFFFAIYISLMLAYAERKDI